MKKNMPALGVNEFDRILDSVKKLKNRLLHEETLRRQWMQDISHDLRTPLTAVKMQVEGMNDGVLEATAERFAALYSELTIIEKPECNLQPELQRLRKSGIRDSLTQSLQNRLISCEIRRFFAFTVRWHGNQESTTMSPRQMRRTNRRLIP